MSKPERDYEYDAHAALFDDVEETGSDAPFDPACPPGEKTHGGAWACEVRGCPHPARAFTGLCPAHHALLCRRALRWLCRKIQAGVWFLTACLFLLLHDPEPVLCLALFGSALLLWGLAHVAARCLQTKGNP